MSAASPRQTADARDPKLVRTELGFDLLVDPGDYLGILLGRDGLFEAPETDLVTRILRPGDVCIDGGCHVGYYSCLMARLVGSHGHVFAIDANPWCCSRTERNLALNGISGVQVIHGALGNATGSTSFRVSSDDQTGLSSLGTIEPYKEVIEVPWVRFEDLFRSQGLDRVRLLKVDVEGSEELLLRGLGRCLADHVIDFIILECYDERLRLLNSSTNALASILGSAGYHAWQYAVDNPVGWSRAEVVVSRGDCNYLFSSRDATDVLPSISLAPVLHWTQEKLRSSRQTMESTQHETARLKEVEARWTSLQRSAGWKVFSKISAVGDRLAPHNSRRRRACNRVVEMLTSRP